MNGSPIPEDIQEHVSEGGQLGLALQDLEAGFGAELEQLEAAAAATAAGRPAAAAQVLDLATLKAEQTRRLDDFEHPDTAYLNSLAPASRRPQLSALDWIARRATAVYTAETMPWHRLRRPHVLRIRGLLEEHYQAATARMLAALRGVLKECWQAQLMNIEDYQAVTSIPAVRGESEPRGRHLSAVELRSLFEACSGPPGEGQRQDSTTRRRHDAAFLALAYSCGLRRSEAVTIDLTDLDLLSGELRIRHGNGRKPRQLTLPPSAFPALRDWLNVRGIEPGPLFCPVLKSGRLLREGDQQRARLSPGGAWRICRERGLQAQIQAPAPHDLRRTWIGDLLDMGVDLTTVQKMAGHASTPAAYDRRDRGVQRLAAVLLKVPYPVPRG